MKTLLKTLKNKSLTKNILNKSSNSFKENTNTLNESNTNLQNFQDLQWTNMDSSLSLSLSLSDINSNNLVAFTSCDDGRVYKGCGNSDNGPCACGPCGR